MGIMDLFRKIQPPKEEDSVIAGIQMVDRWLLEKKEPYKLYMDTTVPTEHGRRKEYSYDEAEERFAFYEKKTNEILRQHGIEGDTMYELYEFLLDISAGIYSNVPYWVDNDGNYKKINDVEKTFANILQYISADNRDAGIVTVEQFWNLVE